MAYIGQSLTEGTRRAYTFVATSGQTTFNAVFGVGAVDVYQNGILLQPSDYNSSSGSSVVLGVGAAVNDEITIIAHNTFSVADTVSSSQGGTFAGAVTASNGLTVDDDGATPLTVDRATSDGTIIDVQKAGTSVGTVGSYLGTYLYMGSAGGTDTHINFVNGNVRPATATGAHLDNSLDLGHSQSRWKDIYLGGGAYIGGTAAANKLDDYEEGTFTPQVLNGWGVTSPTYSYNLGYYTKIGDLVYIRCQIVLSGGSINGNQLKIYGFPFTPRPLDVACTGYFSTASSNAENAFLQIVGSSTIFYFKYRTNTGVTDFNGTFAGSGFSFIMSGMYKTP